VEVVASLSQGRTAAAQCGLFTYRSVSVIFEPPLYYSSYRIKANGMDGTCSTGRERRGSYRVLIGKPEGKRPLGRRGHT